MIIELTKDQQSLLEVYREKWEKIGLCTDPSDRKQAEKYINEAYLSAGLDKPKRIVWCGSPLSQGLIRAIALDENFITSIGESALASVRHSVLESSWASVGQSIGKSVLESVRTSVLESVWKSFGKSVLESVWKSVGKSVWESVGKSVWDSVGKSVWDSLGDSVWDYALVSVRKSIRESVRESVVESLWESGYGNHDASWLGFYEYFRDVLLLKKETKKVSALIELAKFTGWYIPHQNICWVSERHSLLNRDKEGRLHSRTDPACMYPDGWAIYAVHGVRVPEYIIKYPDKISINSIENEENSEIRRIMIDQYDREYKGRYLKDSGATLIDCDLDQYGRALELYRKDIQDDEPLIMVKVLNSSLEPDGSRKEYFLRVPPNIESAKDAQAWTCGEIKDTYNPLIET